MRAPFRSALLAAAVAGASAAVAAPAAAQSISISVQGQAVAQDGWTGDLPKHFEGITLSAAQKSQIIAIQKKHHNWMNALRDSASAVSGAKADDPKLQKRIGEVMAEEHAAFKALLDEEGRRLFDANMAKMHAGHGAAQKEGHGAGHGAAQGSGHGGGHGAGHGAGHGTGRPPAR